MIHRHKVCTACGYVGKASFQITTFSATKCPKCEESTMVPLRSREGQAVLAQTQGAPRTWNDSSSLVR